MFLLLVLGISLCSYAGPGQEDLKGTWKYKVETDQGDLTGTLKFEEKEGALAGDVYTDDGEILSFSKIESRADNTFYMELDTGYELMEITVTLKGNTFEGTVESPSGSFPLTGEKAE